MKPPFETPVSAPAPVSSRPTLADLLRPEANNLDLIRLICASLVIYGHAFTLSPDPAWPALTGDPTLHLGYPGVYCGSIAVKVFFFISGLLVTNSLLTRRSVSHYLCGRFFRIWPALIVVVLVTALGLGPWLSSLSAKEYFSRFAVPRYIAGNLLMSVQGGLPGVFAGNPLPSLVNGVLWTLPFEVGAYLALLFFAAVGLLRHRYLATILLFLMLADPLLPQPWLTRWLGDNPQATYLPSCFAIGAWLALWQDRLTISLGAVGSAALAFVVLRTTALGPLAFHVGLFIAVLYLAGLGWAQRLRLKADLSYGAYLWGFLIQQIIVERFPDRGFLFNFAVSWVIALFVAFLSWHLIERPAIRLGRRVADWWTGPRPGQTPAGASTAYLTP